MNWVWQDLASEPSRKRAAGPPSPEVLAAQREQERQDAYERGFNDGVEAGNRRAMKELGPNLRASVKVVEEMEEFRDALLDQIQENLAALALAVARQLVEREIKAEPEVVANLVRNALSHFPLDQKIRIRLHPADLSAISLEGPQQRPTVTAGRDVRWIPDEAIARGGCVVEGPEQIVDGRIEAALERIYRTVSNG